MVVHKRQRVSLLSQASKHGSVDAQVGKFTVLYCMRTNDDSTGRLSRVQGALRAAGGGEGGGDFKQLQQTIIQ